MKSFKFFSWTQLYSWGLLQIITGYASDKVGRKWPIVLGMWIQAIGIGVVALTSSFWWFFVGNLFLGLGTALVYPTFLAAIGDVAHPSKLCSRTSMLYMTYENICSWKQKKWHFLASNFMKSGQVSQNF